MRATISTELTTIEPTSLILTAATASGGGGGGLTYILPVTGQIFTLDSVVVRTVTGEK